jgi:HlyD family secretion protein
VKSFLITFLAVCAALLVVAGGILWYYRRSVKAAEAKPTPVRVEKVARGELAEIVQAPGEIQPRTKVSISARVSARIVELPFEEGQQVTKGNPNTDPPTSASVLVRLDSTDLAAALRSAQARYEAQKGQIRMAQARVASQKAQIQGTRATLIEATRELQRARQLMETARIARSEYDQAQRRVEELQAQLEAGVHQLEADESNSTVAIHQLEAADAEIVRARDNLSYTVLTSPIDGIVTRLNAKVGELVMTGTMNNAGTVIMEVADLSQMLLMARVSEGEIAGVKVGQPARIRMQAYGDRVFEGTVQTVSLASQSDKENPRYFKTEVLVKTDGERIFSGLSADVDIETTRHRGVLKIPSQAVLGKAIDDLPAAVRDSSPYVDKKKTFATVVFRKETDKALLTPVRVGASDLTHTILEAGVNEADQVIVGPYKTLESLKHEQKVEEEKDTSATLSKTGATTATLTKSALDAATSGAAAALDQDSSSAKSAGNDSLTTAGAK